jgi:hypothetical protein
MREQIREQIKKLRQKMVKEVQTWRSQIAWHHVRGKAVKRTPSIPLPKMSEDLQNAWRKIWHQKLKKYQEEDAVTQRDHDELASGEWEEQKQQGQATLPKNLTLEAI